jgi:hypothetical protein
VSNIRILVYISYCAWIDFVGAWFVYPALTPNFKRETLGMVDSSNVGNMTALNLSGMGAKDSIAQMSEEEE